MRSTLMAEGTERTWVLIFETGDDVMSSLKRFAREAGLDASRFTAIGAFSDATLGYFDWQRKDYDRIPVDEQVEVLSLVGDIACHDGEPQAVRPAALAGRCRDRLDHPRIGRELRDRGIVLRRRLPHGEPPCRDHRAARQFTLQKSAVRCTPHGILRSRQEKGEMVSHLPVCEPVMLPGR